MNATHCMFLSACKRFTSTTMKALTRNEKDWNGRVSCQFQTLLNRLIVSFKFNLFLLLDSNLIIFLKHEGKENLTQTKLTSHLLYSWFSNVLGKIPETLMDFMHLIHVKLDLWFIQLQCAWVFFFLCIVARNIVNLLNSL